MRLLLSAEYRDSPIDSQLPGAHALWYLQSSAEQGALVSHSKVSHDLHAEKS